MIRWALALTVTLLVAPAAHAQVNMTATSANVTEAGSPVKIRLLRWSTDAERDPLIAALNPPPATTPPSAAPAAAAARGGRAAGRGRAGRGGARGRGEPAAPLDPIASLTAAIGRAPTIGYIWTNDVTGYSIKYAIRVPLAGGGERIVLATDRRLGAHTTAWRPVAATPQTDYEFTLLELRLDAKGIGEGKASLTTNVVVDTEAKTVALENYAGTPAILSVTR